MQYRNGRNVQCVVPRINLTPISIICPTCSNSSSDCLESIPCRFKTAIRSSITFSSVYRCRCGVVLFSKCSYGQFTSGGFGRILLYREHAGNTGGYHLEPAYSKVNVVGREAPGGHTRLVRGDDF